MEHLREGLGRRLSGKFRVELDEKKKKKRLTFSSVSHKTVKMNKRGKGRFTVIKYVFIKRIEIFISMRTKVNAISFKKGSLSHNILAKIPRMKFVMMGKTSFSMHEIHGLS